MGRSEHKTMTITEPPLAVAGPQQSPANEKETWPLSFGQQRLWFLDQLQPESALYNMPCLLRISGALNLAALRQAVNALASRHEALRSRFPAIDEHPRQVIDPRLEIPIRFVDCANLPVADRQQETNELVRQEINNPFDIANGPLARLMVI